MRAPPGHTPWSSLTCLSPFRYTVKGVTIMAQGLVSFILQAGETLPAAEWNRPGKTSEVTVDISQSGRDGKEGVKKASHLFKLTATSYFGKGSI